MTALEVKFCTSSVERDTDLRGDHFEGFPLSVLLLLDHLRQFGINSFEGFSSGLRVRPHPRSESLPAFR